MATTTTTQSSGTNWTTVLLTLIAVLFGALYFQKCNEHNTSAKDEANLIAALQDSLHQYRNSDSTKGATIAVIQTEKASLFTSLKSQDTAIRLLQNRVTTYENLLQPGAVVINGGVNTVISKNGIPTKIKSDTIGIDLGGIWSNGSNTVLDTSDGTVNTNIDTPKADINKSPIVVQPFPIYTDEFHDKYIDYTAEMRHDSSSFTVKIYNEFSVVVGNKSGKPYADLHTDNPYSSVKDLRVYQVSVPKQKQFGIGFSGGVTYYSGGFKPYLGLGINYTPIHF